MSKDMKKETLEEVIPMTELVVFLDKIKKNLTNKTEVLTIQLIIDTIKNEFVEKEIKWQQEQMFDIMQQYAAFCVKCDREKLPLLFAKEWFETFNN